MFEQQARVPADRGLSSLGLLLQLAGSVLAAGVAVFMLGIILDDHRHGGSHAFGWMLLLLLASVGRSLMQRRAGLMLLYGDPTKPRRLTGVQHYCAAAFAHTILVGLVLAFGLHAPAKSALAAALGLLAWPLCLAVVCMVPGFRRASHELAATEDKGFEGASILMTVFGVCGVIATGTVLFATVQTRDIEQGSGMIVALALLVLIVRSCLHAHAGVSGLRETSMDRAIEHVRRYASFGVISSLCGCGAGLLFFVSRHASVFAFALNAALAWILMVWPLAIRRFVADRQFNELMAGDDAPAHHRAPDAGLSALGWLLVAHAAASATLLVPQLIGGTSDMAAMLTNISVRSIWFPIGVSVLQAWAGFELVRVSPQSRGVATVYGIVAIATALYINGPALEGLQHGTVITTSFDALVIGAMFFAVVLPIATLVLVHRTIAPTARARFRKAAPNV
jgi:hypothetical protein